jgi:hypothetical protein
MFRVNIIGGSKRSKRTQERRLCSIPPTGMLVAVFWVTVLILFVECIHVRPSISIFIEVEN